MSDENTIKWNELEARVVDAITVLLRAQQQDGASWTVDKIVDCSAGCDQVVKIITMCKQVEDDHGADQHNVEREEKAAFVAKMPISEFDKVDAEWLCTSWCTAVNETIHVPKVLYKADGSHFLIEEYIPGKMLSAFTPPTQAPSNEVCNDEQRSLLDAYREAGRQLKHVHTIRPSATLSPPAPPCGVTAACGFTEYVSLPNEGGRIFSGDFLEYERHNKWSHEPDEDHAKHLFANLQQHDGEDVTSATEELQQTGDSSSAAPLSYTLAHCIALVKKVRELEGLLYPKVTAQHSAVLCHGDFHPDNIICNMPCSSLRNDDAMTTPSRPTITLIDWGDARFCPPENDFDAFYGEYFGTPFWDAVLEGYHNSIIDTAPQHHHDHHQTLDMPLVELLGVKRLLWSTDGQRACKKQQTKRRLLHQFVTQHNIF